MSQQIRTLNTQGQKNPNPVIATFAVISELTQRISSILVHRCSEKEEKRRKTLTQEPILYVLFLIYIILIRLHFI